MSDTTSSIWPSDIRRLELFTEALESANDGIAIYDVVVGSRGPTHRIAYANAAFERQTGYRRDELVGTAPDFLYGESTDRTVAARAKEALLSLRAIEIEIEKKRKDGSRFWAEVSMRPIHDANGRCTAVVTIQRDVTERRKREERLQLYERALEHADDMIAIFARVGVDRWHFDYVNASFEATTGFTRQEVLGRTATLLDGPQTDVEQLESIRRALVGGESFSTEIEYYTKTRESFRVRLRVRPFSYGDSPVTHTIVVYRRAEC